MNKHHQASHLFTVFTRARHERRGSDWTIEILGGVEISSFSIVHLKMAEPSRMDEYLLNKENFGVEESSPVAHKTGIY